MDSLVSIITPTFNKLTTSYDVDVRPNVKSLDLNIELDSVNATYEIIDNHLSEANNPNRVVIRVTAQNGKTRDYKLDVMVRDWAYFSNRLRDLIVDNGQLTPNFDSDINNYAVFYVVIDDVMEVRRFLYSRRDIQSVI